jgi:hypothetical protein
MTEDDPKLKTPLVLHPAKFTVNRMVASYTLTVKSSGTYWDGYCS